jgi:hypothetical protein
MIKLHASYGLKVPAEQEYSSQSFHATAEVEVADSYAANPEALRNALHKLWAELKLAVNDELHGRAPRNGRESRHERAPEPRNGNGQPVNRVRNAEPATKKQIGFLLSLGRRRFDMSADQLRKWLRDRHNADLDNLSKSEAARLIDELNETRNTA